MKSSHRFIILFSICIFLACEADNTLPSAPQEVFVSGRIYNAVDQSPFANWEVNIRHRLTLEERLITDSTGRYELHISNYKQYLLDNGEKPADVDTIFARNDFALFINIGSGPSSCDFYSVQPGRNMRRYQRYNSFPIQQVWDYEMYPSKELSFRFHDTASTPRNFKVYSELELRGLEQEDLYSYWYPIGLELKSNMGTEFCLPIDVPIEVKYRLAEYVGRGLQNPVSDRSFLDTITMTSAGLDRYDILF